MAAAYGRNTNLQLQLMAYRTRETLWPENPATTLARIFKDKAEDAI
jgi:hypothetical protein